jgi:hypothetical protein
MERDTKGGWKIIRGERRFVPLGTKKLAHCKSCLHFRKSYGGYCELNPDAFTHAEAEICENYVNRTWGRENEMR